MESDLNNTFLPSDDTNQSSPLFVFPQQGPPRGPQDEVPISINGVFSNNNLSNFSDSGSGVNLRPSPHVPPHGGTLPPDAVRPFPQTTSFNPLPQSTFYAFDGTYAPPLSHPSASNLTGSSSAALDAREETSSGLRTYPCPCRRDQRWLQLRGPRRRRRRRRRHLSI